MLYSQNASLKMYLVCTILLLAQATALEAIDNNSEIKSPPLPPPSDRPLVIQSKDMKDHHTEDVHIQYRGNDKFCTGTTWGLAKPNNTHIWDPIKQVAKQSYYFRYVTVDMLRCDWPYHKAPKILELFYNDTSIKPYTRISFPSTVPGTTNTFRFLLYVPETEKELKWSVRWTAWQNQQQGQPAILPRYEDDAFNAADYLTWQSERLGLMSLLNGILDQIGYY